MGATSLTRVYGDLLASTLDRIAPELQDAISTGTKMLYFYKKSGNWQGVGSGGNQLIKSVMYALTPADSYNGNSQLATDPVDGITIAAYDWAQAAAPVGINGLEEFKNRSSDGTQIRNLLKDRTKQAILGLEDFYNRGILQGQGKVDTTSITSAYVSPTNASTFVIPFGRLIKFAPSTGSVGSIDPATNSWWQNWAIDASTGTYQATTYAKVMTAVRRLKNLCSRGTGGGPDFYISDQGFAELLEQALASLHRNPDYKTADIPFDHINVFGKPLVWDENVPDVKSGSTTVTYGTVYACNSKFMGYTYDNEHNFTAGPFVKPDNQDVKVAHILAYGSHWTNNRRKLGVASGFDLSITS
jgi:hypothetical protein